MLWELCGHTDEELRRGVYVIESGSVIRHVATPNSPAETTCGLPLDPARAEKREEGGWCFANLACLGLVPWPEPTEFCQECHE